MMKEPEERERERNRENTRDNSSVPRWFHLLLPVVRRLKSIRTEFYWVSVKRNHRPPAGQSPNRNTTLLPLPPPGGVTNEITQSGNCLQSDLKVFFEPDLVVSRLVVACTGFSWVFTSFFLYGLTGFLPST